ncbi:MAG: DUF5050 domain-containing protein [Haliscomenobacter sp.]|uniref:DUF5050 domain-containing protein n=1 Tax=Haliscomenobacter sp. TaxID=2717303 RepID=UPI0029A9FADE|nr:DUF5050 domain-containing protein [Haliscomenobacter sp.]MDX2068282.1 DUF5050 domain-containing protein [Haliscomenobacter sp.]
MQLKTYLVPSTFLLLLAHTCLFGQNKIIWGESPGKIFMANLDGSEVKNILQKNSPSDLVADSIGKRVYWTDDANNAIFSTGLDDKEVVKVYQASAYLQGLTIDKNQLYFVMGNTITKFDLATKKVETVVSSLANALDVALVEGQVYWIEPNKIKRLSLDGKNVEIIVDNLRLTGHLVFNAVDQKLYFYDYGKIYKVNPDGSQLEFVVEGGYFSLDKTGRKLLLTNTNLTHSAWGGISSVNTDGSNRQGVSPTTTNPANVVSLGDKIFWLDKISAYNFQDYLFSISTKPAGYEVRASSALNNPTHLAIDPVAKHIYWVEGGTMIKRTNFAGEDIQIIYTIPATQRLSSIVLDYKNKKFYWTDNNSNKPEIYRMNIDGSRLETISNGIFYPNPSGLVLQVDQNRVYWSDPTIRRIMYAELNGKNPGFIELTSFVPGGLLLDKKGEFLYFAGREITQTTTDQLFKIPAQGGTVETIYQNDFAPTAFAIDLEDEYLYWMDYSQSIKRSDLKSKQIETILDISKIRPARYLGPIQIYRPEDGVVPVDSANAETYKLSPNPFHKDLRVEGLEAGDQIAVYSLWGQKYEMQKVDQAGTVTILGQNLPPGMGFLYIRNKNGKIVAMKIYKY